MKCVRWCNTIAVRYTSFVTSSRFSSSTSAFIIILCTLKSQTHKSIKEDYTRVNSVRWIADVVRSDIFLYIQQILFRDTTSLLTDEFFLNSKVRVFQNLSFSGSKSVKNRMINTTYGAAASL
jgi:hypothetical protein